MFQELNGSKALRRRSLPMHGGTYPAQLQIDLLLADLIYIRY